MCTVNRKAEVEADAESEVVLENVRKSYNEQIVLDNFNVTYLPGETYYLTSPSGSGKTTLLRILAGLTKVDSGSVQGVACCSMVFQEDRLCEDYSAVKNVELVLGRIKHKDEYCGSEVDGGQAVEGKTATQTARSALERILPSESLQKPCRELSGGMKRRVALVRAMEADSEVVLLDEPFTGMDTETRKDAEEYIKERQRGRIIIIATHI